MNGAAKRPLAQFLAAHPRRPAIDPRPCDRCGQTIHPHADDPDERLCLACQVAAAVRV
jgi:hypothetical protein